MQWHGPNNIKLRLQKNSVLYCHSLSSRICSTSPSWMFSTCCFPIEFLILDDQLIKPHPIHAGRWLILIDVDWRWWVLIVVFECSCFFVFCWLLLWNLTWKWQGCQWFWTPSRLAKPSLHVLRRRNLPKKRSKMIISELILKKCWLILTKFQISQNHLASSGLKRLANKKKIICFFWQGWLFLSNLTSEYQGCGIPNQAQLTFFPLAKCPGWKHVVWALISFSAQDT